MYRVICFDFHVKRARNVPTFRLFNNCEAVVDTRARREPSLLPVVVNNAAITRRRVARYRHRRARLGSKSPSGEGHYNRHLFEILCRKKNSKRDAILYSVCVIVIPKITTIILYYVLCYEDVPCNI